MSLRFFLRSLDNSHDCISSVRKLRKQARQGKKVIFDLDRRYHNRTKPGLLDPKIEANQKQSSSSSQWLANSCNWRNKFSFICSMSKTRYDFLQTAADQLRDYGFVPIGSGYKYSYIPGVNPPVYPLVYQYVVEEYVESGRAASVVQAPATTTVAPVGGLLNQTTLVSNGSRMLSAHRAAADLDTTGLVLYAEDTGGSSAGVGAGEEIVLHDVPYESLQFPRHLLYQPSNASNESVSLLETSTTLPPSATTTATVPPTVITKKKVAKQVSVTSTGKWAFVKISDLSVTPYTFREEPLAKRSGIQQEQMRSQLCNQPHPLGKVVDFSKLNLEQR